MPWISLNGQWRKESDELSAGSSHIKYSVLDFPLAGVKWKTHILTVPCREYLCFSEFLHPTHILISLFLHLMGGCEEFSSHYFIWFWLGRQLRYSHSAWVLSCDLDVINHRTVSPWLWWLTQWWGWDLNQVNENFSMTFHMWTHSVSHLRFLAGMI